MKYWNENTKELTEEPIKQKKVEPTEDKEPTEKKATVKNKK